MKPFLECNIWSIQAGMDANGFTFVEKIYYYNSMVGDCNILENTSVGFIQIPEFEIQNLHLLDSLDFDLINKNRIRIIRNVNDIWAIDLSYYEQNIILQ